MMNDNDYLIIARKILEFYFEGKMLDKKALKEVYPELKKKAATFVTLTQNGVLRGCIGSLVAHRALLDDLESNTLSAALHDPRFRALSKEELSITAIEISFLSEPHTVEYNEWDELRQKITQQDGVILEFEGKRATYLPQVWEQIRDFDTFFSSLAQKAGISENIFEQHPNIQIYRVRKISE